MPLAAGLVVGALAMLTLPGCLPGGGLPPPLTAGPSAPAGERRSRELYDRGHMEAAERRHAAAHAAFDSVVNLYPTSRVSTASLRERGVSAYRLGRNREAALDLRRVLAAAPRYETTDTAIVLASALQRSGDPVGALRTLVEHVPERDADADGARIVAATAVRDLASGDAGRLAGQLPERSFLGSLYVRAADEIRPTNPARAAELDRLAARPGGASRSRFEETAPRSPRDARAVGAILPQSGRLAGVARDIEDGARIALAELAKGGGPAYRLEVLPESDPLGVAAAVDELAEHGVGVVLGPLDSEAALVAAGSARGRGLLLVSPTATDTELLAQGPGVVALNALTPQLGEAVGAFAARELGLGRVAVIGADDDHGRVTARGFRSAFEGGGGEVVLEQLVSRGTANYGSALRAARLRGAEALFLASRHESQVLTVLSQIRYYSGGSFRLLGVEVWRDPTFLDRAGGFAEGAIFGDTFLPDRRVTRHWDFRAAYHDQYGRSLASNFPAWGYDAVMLALRHLAGQGSSLPEGTYVGAAATYRIRGGRVEKVPVIARVEGGVPVLVRLFDGAR